MLILKSIWLLKPFDLILKSSVLFVIETLLNEIGEKRGETGKTWDLEIFYKSKEKASFEILKREWGDVLGTLTEPRSEHLEYLL